MASGLARELRESAGYLRDEGWHSTAELMVRSADELERLERRISELEATAAPPPSRWQAALSRLRVGVL